MVQTVAVANAQSVGYTFLLCNQWLILSLSHTGSLKQSRRRELLGSVNTYSTSIAITYILYFLLLIFLAVLGPLFQDGGSSHSWIPHGWRPQPLLFTLQREPINAPKLHAICSNPLTTFCFSSFHFTYSIVLSS